MTLQFHHGEAANRGIGTLDRQKRLVGVLVSFRRLMKVNIFLYYSLSCAIRTHMPFCQIFNKLSLNKPIITVLLHCDWHFFSHLQMYQSIIPKILFFVRTVRNCENQSTGSTFCRGCRTKRLRTVRLLMFYQGSFSRANVSRDFVWNQIGEVTLL